MRFWGLLLGKLAAAALVLCGLWRVMLQFRPVPERYFGRYTPEPFWYDLRWTFATLIFGLLCVGVVAAVLIDQRYRCRTCGRRLRMPIMTGRYAQMLLYGKPKLEYICTYGHGTLKVPELHIGGKEPNSWEPHDDMWKELYSYDKPRDEK